jgi:hypothetical protein
MMDCRAVDWIAVESHQTGSDIGYSRSCAEWVPVESDSAGVG